MLSLIQSLDESRKLPVVKSKTTPRMVHGTLQPSGLETKRLSYPKAHITRPVASARTATKSGASWKKTYERSNGSRAVVDYIIGWPDYTFSAVVSYAPKG